MRAAETFVFVFLRKEKKNAYTCRVSRSLTFD